jgi:hypothetical protein
VLKGRKLVRLIDPTGLQLRFETLKTLTVGRRIDLIYMFPEGIAARRNLERFLKKPDDRLSVSLGTDAWKPKVRPILRTPESWDAIRAPGRPPARRPDGQGCWYTTFDGAAFETWSALGSPRGWP